VEPNPSIHAGLRFKVGRFYDQGMNNFKKFDSTFIRVVILPCNLASAGIFRYNEAD
jgi:hypothetical protein